MTLKLFDVDIEALATLRGWADVSGNWRRSHKVSLYVEDHLVFLSCESIHLIFYSVCFQDANWTESTVNTSTLPRLFYFIFLHMEGQTPWVKNSGLHKSKHNFQYYYWASNICWTIYEGSHLCPLCTFFCWIHLTWCFLFFHSVLLGLAKWCSFLSTVFPHIAHAGGIISSWAETSCHEPQNVDSDHLDAAFLAFRHSSNSRRCHNSLCLSEQLFGKQGE